MTGQSGRMGRHRLDMNTLLCYEHPTHLTGRVTRTPLVTVTGSCSHLLEYLSIGSTTCVVSSSVGSTLFGLNDPCSTGVDLLFDDFFVPEVTPWPAASECARGASIVRGVSADVGFFHWLFFVILTSRANFIHSHWLTLIDSLTCWRNTCGLRSCRPSPSNHPLHFPLSLIWLMLWYNC